MRKETNMANTKFNSTADYVASEQLLASVNVAIALQKPLLVKGEPGTGKTMLAQAVAASLGKKLIIWNIKSTTKAQDGLYMYDTIQRLYDGQFGEEGVDDIAHYIKLGKLGEAFESDGFDHGNQASPFQLRSGSHCAPPASAFPQKLISPRLRGIPLDKPASRHYNVKAGCPDGQPYADVLELVDWLA